MHAWWHKVWCDLIVQLFGLIDSPHAPVLVFISSTGKVNVKYKQTGKVFKVKFASLSRVDDGNMSADLAEGSQLLINMNRKEYP